MQLAIFSRAAARRSARRAAARAAADSESDHLPPGSPVAPPPGPLGDHLPLNTYTLQLLPSCRGWSANVARLATYTDLVMGVGVAALQLYLPMYYLMKSYDKDYSFPRSTRLWWIWKEGAHNRSHLWTRHMLQTLVWVLTWSTWTSSVRALWLPYWDRLSTTILRQFWFSLQIFTSVFVCFMSDIIIHTVPDREGNMGLVANFMAVVVIADLDELMAPACLTFTAMVSDSPGLQEFAEDELEKLNTKPVNEFMYLLFSAVVLWKVLDIAGRQYWRDPANNRYPLEVTILCCLGFVILLVAAIYFVWRRERELLEKSQSSVELLEGDAESSAGLNPDGDSIGGGGEEETENGRSQDNRVEGAHRMPVPPETIGNDTAQSQDTDTTRQKSSKKKPSKKKPVEAEDDRSGDGQPKLASKDGEVKRQKKDGQKKKERRPKERRLEDGPPSEPAKF